MDAAPGEAADGLVPLSRRSSRARDGTIHAVYSYFVAGGKSMKHAAFNEAWVQAPGRPVASIEPAAGRLETRYRYC